MGNPRALPLVVLAVFVATGVLIVVLAIREVQTAQVSAHLGRPSESDDGQQISLTLTLERFDPVADAVTGNARVEISPRMQETVDDVLSIERVELALNHFGPVTDERGQTSEAFVWQGGSNAPLNMTRATGSLAGSGAFTWQVDERVPSFLYPFDRYALYVNPALRVPGEDFGRATVPTIDSTTVYAQMSGMRMDVQALQPADAVADSHEIMLTRPASIQIVTVLIGGLALVWLGYLAAFAKPETIVGSIIAFFVGVWGIRGTLLAGLSIFPVLIDYVVLALSVVAIGIVLTRWSWGLSQPKTSRQCPYCRQTIDPAAVRCPHCTAEVGAETKPATG